MKRNKVIAVLVTMALALWVAPVFAIDQPDTISMDSARAFSDVLESGDLLFVGQFTVSFTNCNSSTTTGCPSETIEEAFLGHLLSTDGVTPIRSSVTVLSNSHTFNGYGAGVFSVYASAADVTALGIVTSTSHFLQIAGNPTVYASVPTNTLAVSSESAKAVLPTHVLNRAANLENSWDFNITTSSGNKLNAAGEDYFSEAIPNLRLMASGIFTASVDAPQFNEKTFNTTQRDAFLAFGSGTRFIDSTEAAFDALETEFGLPKTIVKTLIALGLTLFVVFVITSATGDSRVGALGFAVAFPVGVIMGFGVLEFVAILTLFAAIALAWIVILKSA